MIVRSLDEIKFSERDIKTPKWVSRRLLLQKDGMGFSLHETTIFAGAELKMQYKNHLEAVYCIEGHGELFDIKENKTYPLKEGTLYALNENDQHILRANSLMRFVCVFNPALTGNEVHDSEGSYPLNN